MTSERLRVVIAGGGTGGHLYPGIAVAREILARRADAAITFAGTARGIESRVMPKEGFELDVLRSSGLKGKSVIDRLRGAGTVPLGLLDAWGIVSRRRPRLVLGVGGYSSGPVVMVAALRGVPTMLIEQNAVPGLTNRVLARFVKAAGVTFESTKEFFGSKAFVCGNPVRPEFIADVVAVADVAAIGDGLQTVPLSTESSADERSSRTRVLVFGGSQGAHAINVAMVEAAAQLASGHPPLDLAHQTGERDLEMVRDGYRAAGLPAEVAPFFYDMARRIRWADLVVCRAGATTIAELTAAGKPSILIPLPTATDDHQRKNAEALAAAGAAEVLLQAEASGPALAARISALAADPGRREAIAKRALSLARPDAARVIVDRLLELAAC